MRPLPSHAPPPLEAVLLPSLFVPSSLDADSTLAVQLLVWTTGSRSHLFGRALSFQLSEGRTLLASVGSVNVVDAALFVRLRVTETTALEMLRAQQSYPPSGQGSPARPIAPPSSSPARFTQRASAFLSNRSSGSARSGSGGKSNGSSASSSLRSSESGGSGGGGGGEYARNEDPANLFVRQDRIGESKLGSAPFSTGMFQGLCCIILSSDERGCHGSRQGSVRPQGRRERQRRNYIGGSKGVSMEMRTADLPPSSRH
jgi:hypothetical protein